MSFCHFARLNPCPFIARALLSAERLTSGGARTPLHPAHCQLAYLKAEKDAIECSLQSGDNIYIELMTKEADKHADPVHGKRYAGEVKPSSYRAAYLWSSHTECVKKTISVHSAERIKWTIGFPLDIGQAREVRVEPTNSVEADINAINASGYE
jgi:hypothetical protein